MKLKTRIKHAILDVSPSLKGTKLCSELVDSIAKSVKKHINNKYEDGYSAGKRRANRPIEYADFR